MHKRSIKTNRQQPNRLIQLPTTVGDLPRALNVRLNAQKIPNYSLAFQRDPYGFPADRYVWEESDARWLKELKRLAALRYVLWCDFAVMNFGRSLFRPIPVTQDTSLGKRTALKAYARYGKLMQLIELRSLKARGVPIVVVYQGTDARQLDVLARTADHPLVALTLPDHHNSALDELKRQQIALLSRYATHIYALNPDLLRVLPPEAAFLPYFHVPVSHTRPRSHTWSAGDRLIVGHAPSHRGIKGTEHVIDAVTQLAKEGYPVELRLIEGLSNSDAVRAIAEVHVLVDQLNAGWYGGVAVEAMSLEVPVVSYIHEKDLSLIPFQMAQELPIRSATPESLKEILRGISLMTTAAFSDWCTHSLAYVRKWHAPDLITDRLFEEWFGDRDAS